MTVSIGNNPGGKTLVGSAADFGRESGSDSGAAHPESSSSARQEDAKGGDHSLDAGAADSHAADEHAADEHAADEHAADEHAADGHADDGHTADGHAHDEHAVADPADWGTENSLKWYLSPDHLLGHVQDAPYFELPNLFDGNRFREPYHLKIPQVSPYSEEKPLVKAQSDFLGPITFQPTKFVVLELLGALIVAAIFITLGSKMRDGQPVRGRFWNMLEAMLLYVRDQVAKPAIGSADAARFTPLLWTIFFFVLTLNLLGMVPFFGAATGSISVTAALAFVVFAVVIGTGSKKMGVVGFWKAQVPHMDLPGPLKIVLVPMIWAIEVFGLFVKHLVLAVRLFANMFAGHLVLAVFVAFIGVTWNSWLSLGVLPASIGASTAINLLELLVAFIQAYVFTFLSALFIGAAVHPH